MLQGIFGYALQVTVFMSRTFNRRQGLIAGGVVAAVHLLFLLYLHFAYHSVYEGKLALSLLLSHLQPTTTESCPNHQPFHPLIEAHWAKAISDWNF